MDFFFFLQVQNLMAVHPDYGTRVQTLLDKYNAGGKKVGNVLISLTHFLVHPTYYLVKEFHLEIASKLYN